MLLTAIFLSIWVPNLEMTAPSNVAIPLVPPSLIPNF